MLRLTRTSVSLVRVLSTFVFTFEENVERRKWKSPRSCCTAEFLKVQKSGQFPDDPVRITV
jgi:hypothetical protein